MPTLGHSVPTGSQWAYEIKHDGFRFICRRDGDRVRVFSDGGVVGGLPQGGAREETQEPPGPPMGSGKWGSWG